MRLITSEDLMQNMMIMVNNTVLYTEGYLESRS